MRHKLSILFVAVGLLFAAVPSAFAQDSTTGAVRGIVRDKATGEGVAGATVVATSPSLQGQQTEITGGDGSYYLSNLAPGTYLITIYYADAKFARGNVLITLGSVAKVNIGISMDVGKGEVVEIEGNAPIIDQQSTKTAKTIDENYTKNVPTGRTFAGVLGAAAGSQGDLYGVSFGGSSSVENTYIVEGINTTDPGFGLLSSNLPNEFIRETEVITGGYNAEYGRATGGIINVITKSGSNEFHGSVFSYWTPGALVADEQKIARAGSAINRDSNLSNSFDMGAEVGGPIIKDKVWFHVGFNPSMRFTDVDRVIQSQVDENQDGIPDTDDNGFTVFDELARTKLKSNSKTYFYSAKLTGAVTPEHQGSLSAMGSPGTASAITTVTGEQSAGALDLKTNLIDIAGKWTSKFNDNKSQLDVVAGYHYDKTNQTPGLDGGDAGQVRYETARPLTDFMGLEGSVPEGCSDGAGDKYPLIDNCPVPFYRTGGVAFLEDTKATRLQGRLDFTQRLKMAGHHEIKIGADVEDQGYDSRRQITGGKWIRQRSSTVWTVRRFFSVDDDGDEACGSDINGDGMPDARCAAQDVLDVNTKTRNLGAYVRDSWSILPNLTFNAGMRWEQQTLFTADQVAGQISPATGEPIPEKAFTLGEMFAPRLGLIYDPTQEGRSRLYGHWGRFYESIPMDINVRAYGGEILNINVLPPDGCDIDDPSGTCDESNLLQGPLFLGSGEEMVSPGMKAQYLDEIILGGEYELFPDFKVGASYIRRDLGRVIEDVSSDGASTYILANPGETDPSAIADLRREADALRATGNMEDAARANFREFQADQFEAVGTFDKPNRTYDALQLTADKRFTKNMLVTASYTYSRLRGNFPGLFSPETGQLDPNLTSMYDLPDLMANRYGDLAADRPHLLKVDGFYRHDAQKVGLFTFGGRFRASSGIPHNVLGAHNVYGNGESYLVPRGSEITYVDENGDEKTIGRSPLTTRIDAHLSYGRKLSDGMVLEAFVDIFNVLNQQPEVDRDEIYTFDDANPIVGGDSKDLEHAKALDGSGLSQATTVERNPNYGNINSRQAPLSARFGLRLTF